MLNLRLLYSKGVKMSSVTTGISPLANVRSPHPRIRACALLGGECEPGFVTRHVTRFQLEFRATREYSLVLRLVSKLPDLRTANANQDLKRLALQILVRRAVSTTKREGRPEPSLSLCGGDNWNRTSDLYDVNVAL